MANALGVAGDWQHAPERSALFCRGCRQIQPGAQSTDPSLRDGRGRTRCTRCPCRAEFRIRGSRAAARVAGGSGLRIRPAGAEPGRAAGDGTARGTARDLPLRGRSSLSPAADSCFRRGRPRGRHGSLQQCHDAALSPELRGTPGRAGARCLGPPPRERTPRRGQRNRIVRLGAPAGGGRSQRVAALGGSRAGALRLQPLLPVDDRDPRVSLAAARLPAARSLAREGCRPRPRARDPVSVPGRAHAPAAAVAVRVVRRPGAARPGDHPGAEDDGRRSLSRAGARSASLHRRLGWARAARVSESQPGRLAQRARRGLQPRRARPVGWIACPDSAAP
jgi:hypothetical protein